MDSFEQIQKAGQDALSKAMVSIPGWAAAFNSRGSGGTLAYTRSPWANRCIEIRMAALSKVPWEIADADGEPVDGGELVDMLEESRIKNLLKLAEADLCLTGHAFWEKGLDGDTLIGLRRLNASVMQVETTAEGVARFLYSPIKGGSPKEFSVEEIVWFHEFDPNDDLDGVAKVDVAAMAIDAEYNADRYITAFFKNFALPPVIFTSPDVLPEGESEKATAWWRRLFGGVQNQHKAGFLGRGMKPEMLGYSPDKLALEAIRLEARRSICATFGVPPTVANASDPGSYATADEQRQSLYEETIVPRAEWYAEQITEQVVALFDPTQEFRFRTEDLPTMQEDENKKAERLSALVTAGIITAQAAAEELEYTLEETGEGRQQQFGGLGGFGQEPASVPEKAIFQPSDEPQQGLLADMRRWRHKSVKRVKAGKSAVFPFHSESIPASFQQAIHGQLEGANTSDEVHAVFDRAERDVVSGKAKESDDMNLKDTIELFRAMQPAQSAGITLSLPGATVYANEAAVVVEAVAAGVKSAIANLPAVVVNTPEPIVNFDIQNNVNPAEVVNVVEVAAPDMSELTSAMKGKPAEPRLRSRKEKSKVTRDRKGDMLGTETVSVYEYDDEE